MQGEQKVGGLQLSTRLRGVSPPVTRRLRVAEQTSLGECTRCCKSPSAGAMSTCMPFRSVAGNSAIRPGVIDCEEYDKPGAEAGAISGYRPSGRSGAKSSE